MKYIISGDSSVSSWRQLLTWRRWRRELSWLAYQLPIGLQRKRYGVTRELMIKDDELTHALHNGHCRFVYRSSWQRTSFSMCIGCVQKLNSNYRVDIFSAF